MIAYGHGGSLETVRVADPQGKSDTGVLFSTQTVESAMEGIQAFEAREREFTPTDIRDHACTFDTSVFTRKMRDLVCHLTERENETYDLSPFA